MQTEQQTEKDERNWERTAAMTLTVALWGAGAYLVLRYAIGILLPFLLALAVSAVIRPLAAAVSGRLKISRRFSAFVLTLLLLVLAVSLLLLGCNRLLSECNRLLDWLGRESGGGADAVARLERWFTGLGERMPLVGKMQNAPAFSALFARVDEMLTAALTGLVGELSARLPAFAAGIAGAAPSVLLFTITFVLSCFYFSVDDGEIGGFFSSILPASAKARLARLRPRLRRTAVRYLRAYLLLMAITSLELFIGFSVLGIPYAFLAALLVAFVDLLPVFGTGTVLIPWAVIRLFAGDIRTGIGLLILYAVTLLVRQFAEPHIVGGSIGQHPLVTLFSMYVGYRLFGLTGLLFGPFVALLIRTVCFSDGTGNVAGVPAPPDEGARDKEKRPDGERMPASGSLHKRQNVFCRGKKNGGE